MKSKLCMSVCLSLIPIFLPFDSYAKGTSSTSGLNPQEVQSISKNLKTTCKNAGDCKDNQKNDCSCSQPQPQPQTGGKN